MWGKRIKAVKYDIAKNDYYEHHEKENRFGASISVWWSFSPGGNLANGRSIAIGDADTGLKQAENGVLQAFVNNQRVTEWRTDKMRVQKPIMHEAPQSSKPYALTRKDYVNSMIHESDNDTKIRTKGGHDLIHLGNSKRVYIGHHQPWAINTFSVTSVANNENAKDMLAWLPNGTIIRGVSDSDIYMYFKGTTGDKMYRRFQKAGRLTLHRL